MRVKDWPLTVSAAVLVIVTMAAVASGQVTPPVPVPISVKSADIFDQYTFCDFAAIGPDNCTYGWDFPDGVTFRERDEFGLTVEAIGPPGDYVVELTAIGPSGNTQRPYKFKKVYKSFTIKGQKPKPDPDKPDDDGVPAGKYGLAKVVVTEFKNASLDKATAGQVAAVFGNVAKKLRDGGQYADLEAAMEDVAKQATAIVKDKVDYAIWKKTLNDIATTMDGKLTETNKPVDLADAFAEIQTGGVWYSSH